MKRPGQRQTTLDAYFGKRLRVTTDDDRENGENVVVATGMTALQMIAHAYADVEEEQEEPEQSIFCAKPAEVAHDHDYFVTSVRADVVAEDDETFAKPELVEHDHTYAGSSGMPAQTGGAYGFDSSDDEPPREADDGAVDENSGDNTVEEEGDEDEQEALPAEELNLEDLYEVVDRRVKRVKKFGLNGYATKFVLKDDERVDQPVEMLRHVLQRFINEALENSREYGYSTDWMGLSFIAESMKKGNGGKGEWLVPFNPPNENNADKILQEMEKFDQPENSPELFGNHITMIVTTVRRPVGGAMDGLIRKKQIRRPEKDPAIVEINNRDNLCLFREICVHIYYYKTGEGKWRDAERYACKAELDLAALTLRLQAGIPRRSTYGLDDAKAIFEHLQ